MGYPIYKTNYQLMAQSRETEKNSKKIHIMYRYMVYNKQIKRGQKQL